MKQGIRIEGGGDATIRNNTVLGCQDVGINVINCLGVEVADNHVSENEFFDAEAIYGPAFQDVVQAVNMSGNEEAAAALNIIVSTSEPDETVGAWTTVIRTCGNVLGNFSVSTLSNVFSVPAYQLLKAFCHAHNIPLP